MEIHGTTVHSGRPSKLRKCTYTGHCAAVWSVEHAIQLLDEIAQMTDSDDCLPFAIRLVESGELVQIAEDNGEFGCGDLLIECLSKLEKYNVLVCVSRNIRDSFVLDMYQRQKYSVIKDAANSAIDVIHAHFVGIEERGGRIPESEEDRSVVVHLPFPSAEGAKSTQNTIKSKVIADTIRSKVGDRPTAPMSRVSVDMMGCINADNSSSPAAAGKDSVMKRKLKDSLLRAKSLV